MMKRYVIVGNGIAAAGCIEGIREKDKEGVITVVSAERHAVYCRPLISYYLEKKTDIERMGYRDENFYADNGCEVLYGRSAVAIDAAARRVTLDDGSVLPYSALCLACGAEPLLPPIEGLEAVSDKFCFMMLDDALALEKALKEESRVLIVGGGLIGLKCAEGISGRVKSVTVCEQARQLLPSMLDAASAATVQRHLTENGIELILGDSVERFQPGRALLRSGRSAEFDILVMAAGIRPRTELLRAAGGETDRGILVDERMATSLDGIYAAGDCTQGMDICSGERRVLALLPNAYMQGHAAGVNMAGGSELFDRGMPMNSVGFFGLHIMSAGRCEGEVYEEKSESGLKRLYIGEGRLNGFILTGDTERAGIYTALIREKTPLDEIDFELLKKVATSAAFPAEIRRKKFGGVI